MRSIDTAIDYENLLLALKAGNWRKSARIALIRPKAVALLRLPLFWRFQKLARWLMARMPAVHPSVRKPGNSDAANQANKDAFDGIEV